MVSVPCSCLTAVAAEGTWTEGGVGVETVVDGPAVTAGPTLGSVLTAVTKSESREMCMRQDHMFCAVEGREKNQA